MNMRPLTKARAYDILFRINKKQGIKIDEYIEKLSRSGDIIPIEVILFINKYNSSTIPQLKVFNIIYEKRNKNPLYKTLMKESCSPDEQCLVLNSLITQCLIQMKNLDIESRESFVDIMNVQDILNAITDYLIEGNTKQLNKVFFEVRSIFKNLFSKKDI